MFRRHIIPAFAIACTILASSTASTRAQHSDILVQSVNGQLATGSTFTAPPTTVLGVRAFDEFLDEDSVAFEPGFESIGSPEALPVEASPLPADQDLVWDFLPLKIARQASNLFYWNAAEPTAEVDFGLPPAADYSFSMFGLSGDRIAAGTQAGLVPGVTIGTTADDGSMHEDPVYFLDDDADDANETAAAPGVYLVALRLRMETLDRSDPFYLVWGTAGASAEALEAAHEWVEEHADLLAPNFAADFDGDLDVDGGDFLVWQRHTGRAAGALQIDGDANRDHAVTDADLAVLRSEFGSQLSTFPGVPAAGPLNVVPEPSAFALALVAATMGRRRGRARPLGNGGAI